MTDPVEANFVLEPSPEHPGWLTFDIPLPDVYNTAVMGPLLVRREGDQCRLRSFPRRELRNLLNAIHGGALLGLIDVSLFAGMRMLTSTDAAGGITIDLSTQFIGAGNLALPLDAVVEVMRETGRLLFLRGVLEQEGALVASFHGTIRKPASKLGHPA